MTEPFRDDSLDEPWPEPEPQYVDEDLMHFAPYFLARCDGCGTQTTHGEFCDEDGANRITGCIACRRVLTEPRPALPLPKAWQQLVNYRDDE